MDKPLLSFKQAHEWLGVSAKTLQRRQQEGEITFSRIGGSWKISENDLRLYYEKQKQTIVPIEPAPKTRRRKYITTEHKLVPIRYNKNGKPVYV
jgi:excisionase family DNA binding protein